jgi:hypothetical protein
MRFFAPAFAAAALAACLIGVPRVAVAGAVYRCSGPNGQIAFTNKTAGYKGCTRVSSYSEPTKATPSTSKRVDYRSDTDPAPGADASTAANNAAEAKPAVETDDDKGTQIHRGAVYKIVRANGITEYTNIRPGRGAFQVLFTYISTCYACNLHSTINWTSTALNLTAYKSEVAAAASEFGIDPALLRAVIHAESAFNPNAISDKGAEGLMQLIPGTASDMGVANPFDASQNIRGGAQYLAGLLKQFNGDSRLATAAYNAGPQNVLKYNGVPPFDETKVYVDRVATLRQRYHAAE